MSGRWMGDPHTDAADPTRAEPLRRFQDVWWRRVRDVPLYERLITLVVLVAHRQTTKFDAAFTACGCTLAQPVTQILGAIQRGELNAAESLLPLVYSELRRLAAQSLAKESPGVMDRAKDIRRGERRIERRVDID